MARTAIARMPSVTFHRAAPAPIQRASSARYAMARAKAKEAIKRASARVARGAVAQKHRLASIGVGIGLGLARRFAPDTMSKLSFGPLTPETVVGVAAWIASYFVKSEVLDHIATGALTIAAYQFAGGMSAEGEFANIGEV